MGEYLVLVLVVVTSCTAYLVGAAGFGLPRAGLRPAVGRVLECVGLSLVFLVANVLVGIVAILALRALTKTSVSVYLVADEALPVLSLLQGLTFLYWRDHSAPASKVVSSPDQPQAFGH